MYAQCIHVPQPQCTLWVCCVPLCTSVYTLSKSAMSDGFALDSSAAAMATSYRRGIGGGMQHDDRVLKWTICLASHLEE